MREGSVTAGRPSRLGRRLFAGYLVVACVGVALAGLLVDGIVYLLGNSLTAVDAKTGVKIYQQKIDNQIYRGNMVYADGKICIVGKSGIGQVVQAGKAFKLLATNELKETVYASPAIADGRIYIRTFENLYCIGTK